MKRTALIIAGLLLVAGGGSAWYLISNAPPSRRTPKTETPDPGLQAPAYHVEHTLARADTVVPHPAPDLVQTIPPPPVQAATPEKKLAPMRIYTSTATPEPTPEPEPEGDYAPAFRMVRCKLVNTIDSSEITTPIIGLVTDDVVWDGKVIIAKCSEVHGVAQVDKSRERIAAAGAWTFTLYDATNPGLGRELVVTGQALDRSDDPEFTKLLVGAAEVDNVKHTWGITDGSAGMRGVIIKSNNISQLQLFTALFIGGIAQSVQGSVTNIFGQAVPSVGSGGGLTNAPAQGTQNVLDRYAEMLMSAIEKDGFFVRVPAGKLFYVLVTEDILTAKATVGGARRLHEVQSQFLEDRDQEEKVTEPRSTRDAAKASQTPPPYVPIDPALTHSLDAASGVLEKRSEELQKQSDQLAHPSPAP